MDELPRALRDRRILVTGGAGFIGSHLTEALVDHNEVVVLDDLSTGTRENVPAEAELVVGDIRDTGTVTELVADADVVFHQAAVVDVEASIEHPVDCHEINAAGTLTVLEVLRRHGGKLVSSFYQVGPSTRNPTPSRLTDRMQKPHVAVWALEAQR